MHGATIYCVFWYNQTYLVSKFGFVEVRQSFDPDWNPSTEFSLNQTKSDAQGIASLRCKITWHVWIWVQGARFGGLTAAKRICHQFDLKKSYVIQGSQRTTYRMVWLELIHLIDMTSLIYNNWK